MPDPITAPIPRAVRLQGPSVFARRLPGSSDAAISASMLLVRNRCDTPADYRLRWPCAARLIFFFIDPRATPEARLVLGGAALRALRFSFFRSVRSVTVFVFISLFSILRIFRPVS